MVTAREIWYRQKRKANGWKWQHISPTIPKGKQKAMSTMQKMKLTSTNSLRNCPILSTNISNKHLILQHILATDSFKIIPAPVIYSSIPSQPSQEHSPTHSVPSPPIQCSGFDQPDFDNCLPKGRKPRDVVGWHPPPKLSRHLQI